MKKALIIILAAALLMLAVGCSKPAGIEPGSAFKEDADMALVINGKTYAVRTDSAPVISVLGEDYAYEETVSCIYEGYDKTFNYGDITVYTVPVDDQDIIEMFTVTGGDYATPRGIKVGSTRQDVLTAYGENFTSDDGYYLTYTEDGNPENFSAMRVMFRMENDKVVEFSVYSPSYSND